MFIYNIYTVYTEEWANHVDIRMFILTACSFLNRIYNSEDNQFIVMDLLWRQSKFVHVFSVDFPFSGAVLKPPGRC